MAYANCGGKLSGYSSRGGRKYMEDFITVVYFSPKSKKTVYAFFGIFDGHGGSEAAEFANQHLLDSIINQKLFWSDCDSEVLRAIRQGYISTHCAMWKQQENWPKTASGLPSTAGTTATIAFIRGSKIYIGHVGDSGVALGYEDENESEHIWKAKQLTQDHKPESPAEKARIINSGGKVINKSGVPRVVWNRPRVGHKGPVRRSTPFDEIPFLAVARSLGDLWSYNSALNKFVVSPDPDLRVIKIDKTFRCLVFGTDGLWNVISPSEAVSVVREADINSKQDAELNNDESNNEWQNPSKYLLGKALERWRSRKMRADNTSVVTFIFDEEFLDTISNDFTSDCTIDSFDIHSDDMGYNTLNIQRLDDMDVNSYEDSHDTFIRNKEIIEPNLEGDIVAEICYSDHSSSLIEDTNSIIKRFDTSPNNNDFVQICNISEDPILDNSSSNYIFEKNALPKTIYEQKIQESSTKSSYVNDNSSFAESYNSLLLTNLQNESSSDCSKSDNLDIVDETNRHIYKSLNETGLAGHDYIYQHLPNTSNEQQQHQYQQACMLGEGGYSLTKLETRCEQKLRNTSTSFLLNNINSKRENLRTFQTSQALLNTDNADLDNFVQFNSISSSTKNVQPNKCNNHTEEYESISAICNYKTSSTKNISEMKKISKLDNAYINTEITSTILESESSNQSLNCEIFHNSCSAIKKLNRKRKNSEVRYDDFNKSLRASTSSCFPDKQNENNLSTNEQKPINYTKRTLRSRNSLTKEIIKTNNKKSQSATRMQLKRTILNKEFLKSLKSSSTMCKLRTRQQHQQFTIWSNTKSKRNTINNSPALCSNSNLNKTNNNLSSIGNSSNKNKNSNTSISSSSTNSSNSTTSCNSSNKIRLRELSTASPPKTRSSSSTIAAKRNKPSSLVGKNVVQTRNRVQKR